MQTTIWDMREYKKMPLTFAGLKHIKEIYDQGGLVAIPTETVYGLGANARDEQAVTRIYEAKGRPSDNPLIVHIHSQHQLEDFVAEVPEEVNTFMDVFWPGPISFILPLKKGYLCEKVTGGLDSIAVRMPSHPIGRAILQYVNLPIAAPSANLSGRPSPTTFQHVYNDLNGKIEGIVNGDQSEEGLESTVLDCTRYPFKIARPGAVTQTMLNEVIPDSVIYYNYNSIDKPIAPGMKYKHYSPETPISMVTNLTQPIENDKDWTNVAFILPKTLKQFVPQDAFFIPLCEDENDIKGANHNLYHILHVIDENLSIHEAFVYAFNDENDSEAIMNRMTKATGNHIVRGEDL